MSQKGKSQIPQRLKRNERERKRVDQVNQGFNQLRERVPKSKGKQKLSKVETLREAVNYIRQLQALLGDASLSQLCSYSSSHSSVGTMPAFPVSTSTGSFPSPSFNPSAVNRHCFISTSSCSTYFPQQYGNSMCDSSPNSSYYTSSDSSFEEKGQHYYAPF